MAPKIKVFLPGKLSLYGDIYSMDLHDDGKLLIGGDFSTYNNISRNRVGRILPDGTVDTNFNPGIGPNDNVYYVVALGDGKALIAGEFTSFGETARNYIARLNADGTLDANFIPSEVVNAPVNKLIVQADSKIIVFSYDSDNTNCTERCNLYRLHPDGSLDTGFNPVIDSDILFFPEHVLSDGRIFITSIDKNSQSLDSISIFILNEDGSYHSDIFQLGFKGSDISVGSYVQPDGRVLLAGTFSGINGAPRSGIARILMDYTPAARETTRSQDVGFELYPNPAHDRFAVEMAQPGAYTLQVFNAHGQLVMQTAFTNLQHTVSTQGLAAGLYTVQMQGPKGISTRRLVIH